MIQTLMHLMSQIQAEEQKKGLKSTPPASIKVGHVSQRTKSFLVKSPSHQELLKTTTENPQVSKEALVTSRARPSPSRLPRRPRPPRGRPPRVPRPRPLPFSTAGTTTAAGVTTASADTFTAGAPELSRTKEEATSARRTRFPRPPRPRRRLAPSAAQATPSATAAALSAAPAAPSVPPMIVFNS